MNRRCFLILQRLKPILFISKWRIIYSLGTYLGLIRHFLFELAVDTWTALSRVALREGRGAPKTLQFHSQRISGSQIRSITSESARDLHTSQTETFLLFSTPADRWRLLSQRPASLFAQYTKVKYWILGTKEILLFSISISVALYLIVCVMA